MAGTSAAPDIVHEQNAEMVNESVDEERQSTCVASGPKAVVLLCVYTSCAIDTQLV